MNSYEASNSRNGYHCAVKTYFDLRKFNSAYQGIELTGDTPRFDLTDRAMPIVIRNRPMKYIGTLTFIFFIYFTPIYKFAFLFIYVMPTISASTQPIGIDSHMPNTPILSKLERK